jgi:hypothetical protein
MSFIGVVDLLAAWAKEKGGSRENEAPPSKREAGRGNLFYELIPGAVRPVTRAIVPLGLIRPVRNRRERDDDDAWGAYLGFPA